ncbi:MAG: uracil-DNA glycosylase [Polynucleobacter sp. 24-46-87]|jgi:uracil-DNA glycosylase|uniref:uracil-DNA glycosylase n=1 Tax=unclassified Polynucleobacter TaxID=2640945 RepID=UPI000BD64172|nr:MULTISPECIES: uracil-DNA glycosylase [unclassified Polynucleobacter]OYY21150.1 MAG: uracil-DNA glycosylase [Polynucleobacter sp. 35-46-11]OZA16330.1 MAG: uracil-DNA glycosylase [Polynucleobacter sp. 24-46-87]OZA78453.1 MAG: uracil-DNA glycosylase [Polynucleobacter sp. 39-46-10]
MHSFSAADIPEDWRALLGDYFESPEWQQLQTNLRAELNKDAERILPEPHNFFKALTLTPVTQVKVVILGQDPYHSAGLAQGLAFSIPSDIPTNSRQFPSSLRNISKALALEGFGALPNGDLHTWAEQGVLLINTALSVKLGEAGSHANLGWKSLVDRLISALAQQKPYLVWMLWGGHAQSKLPLIEAAPNQLILQSSHPSGLGVYKTDRPFLEQGGMASCGHFTKANEWLTAHQQSPIQWVGDHTSSTDKALFSLSS